MNFFGFNISLPRFGSSLTAAAPLATLTRTTPEADSPVARWLRGDHSSMDGPTLQNAYQQVVWVYRAVNVLAEQIASIPFLFSTGSRGDETLIQTGPLIDFYNRPHPHISRYHFWELRVMWLMLRGECFRIPIYGERAGRRVLQRVLIP
jgi:phage portal protein BeeE